VRPTVGVIIPVYDGAGFLADALDSLTVQSDPVRQVVVIDDGSQDASVQIARGYLRDLPLEIVRLGGRSGVSAARNAGVARLTTDLVTFLDADDLWLPEHARSVVDAFVVHGGIISPRAVRLYPDGSTRVYRRRLLTSIPTGRRQLPVLLQRNFVFVGSLVSRVDLTAVGGFREPNVGEDWDLWIRLLNRGLTVTELASPTVLYRRHGHNTTANRAASLPTIVEVLERAERELDERYRPAARRAKARFAAELEVERALDRGERPSWRVLRAGLRGDRRMRAKTLAYTMSPRLTHRWTERGALRGSAPSPPAG
jgi:glycosyltransferase involved in cell wall biosynthesis